MTGRAGSLADNVQVSWKMAGVVFSLPYRSIPHLRQHGRSAAVRAAFLPPVAGIPHALLSNSVRVPRLCDLEVRCWPFLPSRTDKRYVMGLDPGRKRDHFGAAIAHREGETVVVDWCREWKPGIFGLKYADVLPEIWKVAREYRIRKIASDQVDFGGIEASIPRANNRPEFELERIVTGGQGGAELCDVTRGLFATRKLLLPDQSGLADEFKRLADYLSQGGGRDVRAKRGHDDRSRAVMLAVYQAYAHPQSRAPICEFLPIRRPTSGGDPYDPFDETGFTSPRERVPSFGRSRF